MGLSPWNDSRFTHSTAQLNLGYNSNGKLEVVTILNISNISTHYLHHNEDNCTYKYNPEIHLGAVTGIDHDWIYDTEHDPKYPTHTWPESYPCPIKKSKINQLYCYIFYKHI